MKSGRHYFKELRLQQLRAIVVLSRGKGFAGAAAALNLTTPSVWQQVRSLEREFGLPLVEVNGLHVSLTEQGRILLDLAEPVVHGFDSIRELFDERSRQIAPRLRIAAPNSVLVNELPEPIRRYRERHPEVELNLIDCPSKTARKLLEGGEVDLAVTGQLESNYPSTISAEGVTSYPFTLVCPAKHPILDAASIRLKDLAQYPLVMQSPGTNSRQRVDDVFDRAGIQQKLRVAFTASTKEVLLQYVQLEFGIAVVSISRKYLSKSQKPRRSSQGLAFRDLSKIFGHEHIVIMCRRRRQEPAYFRAFRETLLTDAEPAPATTGARPTKKS